MCWHPAFEMLYIPPGFKQTAPVLTLTSHLKSDRALLTSSRLRDTLGHSFIHSFNTQWAYYILGPTVKDTP